MSRPKGSKNVANRPTKVCTTCKKKKKLLYFYKSFNPLHADGYTPICKECVIEACSNKDGTVNEEKVKNVMRQLDKPFLEQEWENVLNRFGTKESVTILVGNYIKIINSLSQYKEMTYVDGLEQNQKKARMDTGSPTLTKKKNSSYHDLYYLTNDDFQVTEEIIRQFGEGYNAKEYEIMDRIYNNMKNDYPNITKAQNNMLLRYVRFSAKEEVATSTGDTLSAEKWAKLSNEALKQLNQSENQSEINSFSEFFQKVERAKDIIPILPKYKYRPNDAPDFIIWCLVNYCRRVEGKTECSYEDIYRFYDERKAEYIAQYGDPYGVFTDDPSMQNRKKIEEFIKLPPDFNMVDDD